jgi:hypothetical protein
MLSGVSSRLRFGSMRIFECPEAVRLHIKADGTGDIFLARGDKPVYTSRLVEQHSNKGALETLQWLAESDVDHPELLDIAKQLLEPSHLASTAFTHEPPCRSARRPEKTKSEAFFAKRRLFLNLLPKGLHLEELNPTELGLKVLK